MGYSIDGGFGEYAVAYARYVVKVPDGVDPFDAAPLTCAGVTTYKAVKVAGTRSSDLVAVFGVGGLGHLAIQYAAIAGGRVIAVDIHDEKLDLARELGAEFTVNAAKEDPVEAIQRLGGADQAIALAVSPRAFEQAYGSLRRGGTLVFVALPADNDVTLPIFETVLNGITIVGSIVGTRTDLREVFELHAAGRTTRDPRDPLARATSTRRSPTSRPAASPPASSSRPKPRRGTRSWQSWNRPRRRSSTRPPPASRPATKTSSAGSGSPPTTGEYHDDLTPATGKPFTQVPYSGAADIELALDAAHAAKDAWGEASTTERARVLNGIADAIEDNLETLAIAESYDNGKPIRETRAADVPLAADHFRYFASVIRGEEGTSSEIDKDTVAYHFREPLGVVGQIIPFNFPLLMAAWKMAPAIAAGNCTVLKPASPTPWSILKFAELIAGHPPGRRDQHRQRPRRRDRQGAGDQQANREDLLHRRDRHRAADHAVRRPEHHPVDDRAGRQVAERLLRRRDGRRRRVPRQGHRGARPLRLQQGRGLHLPLPRADPRVDLRRVHGALPAANRRDPPGPPARPLDDARRRRSRSPSSRRSSATARSGSRRAPSC